MFCCTILDIPFRDTDVNFFPADLVLKVRPPLISEVNKFRENSTLISFLYPAQNKELIEKLGSKKINAFGKIFLFK